MKKSSSKTEYLNRKFEFNIGIFVFVAILIYIIVCLSIASKDESIRGYQVRKGALSENRMYTGIALRKENVINSDYSGYVNYFVREGERTSYNNLVYCIDETGKLSDLIGNNPLEDNSLTAAELTSLRQDIQLFSKSFDVTSFTDTVVFRSSILNELGQIENRRIIEDVASLKNSNSNDIINYCRSQYPGIVTYYTDGFESKKPGDITLSDFKEENYEITTRVNDDLIEAGTFAYKYVEDENWSLVIMVPSEEASQLLSMEYVEVKFQKTLTSSWAKVSFINSFDGYSLINLEFTNSMVTFCKDRFVDIELLLDSDSGLKVPNSAIAEKQFYIIDKDYVTLGNNSSDYTVLRQEYDENGSIVKSVTVDIYKEEEDCYYVDTLSLDYGNILVKPGAPVTTTNENNLIVSKTGSLIGVYNINKGYAEFNRVEILYSNDEYSIVSPNSAYGLRAYDYIALDAKIVSDKDFVY